MTRLSFNQLRNAFLAEAPKLTARSAYGPYGNNWATGGTSLESLVDFYFNRKPLNLWGTWHRHSQ